MNGNMLLKELTRESTHGEMKYRIQRSSLGYQHHVPESITALVLICLLQRISLSTVLKVTHHLESKIWLGMFGNLLISLQMNILIIFSWKVDPNMTYKILEDGSIKTNGCTSKLACGISQPLMKLWNHLLLGSPQQLLLTSTELISTTNGCQWVSHSIELPHLASDVSKILLILVQLRSISTLSKRSSSNDQIKSFEYK
jgi:hypothetical protein